jgi:hypothetical protein
MDEVAYFTNLSICHRTTDILLIGKHEKGCTRQSLHDNGISAEAYGVGEADAPPPSIEHVTLFCNLPCASDRLSQRPTRGRQSAQSNCANMAAMCADHPHPLHDYVRLNK